MGKKIEAACAMKALQKSDFSARLWKKDPALWNDAPEHAAVIRNSLGWLSMPEVMAKRTGELRSFAAEASKAGFENAVVLGMGGSSLAPEVFRRSFPKANGLRLHVLDSTHPETVAALTEKAPPKKTLYFLSSKSGGTTEPMSFFKHFKALVPGSHFVAITDPGTSLEKLAQENGFRKTFINFPDIGGRYSALSYFGLAPAAVLGVDLDALLARAQAMARACGPDSAAEGNPGLCLGSWMFSQARAGRDKLTFLITPELASLGLWLEQLIAESVGKEGKGVVPLCDEPPLPAEKYGNDRCFVHIRLKTGSNRELDARAQALAKLHPVQTLEVADALELGAEFYRWEIATAALGHFLAIDPFDQPDVQSAKDRTKAVLEQLSKTGSLPSPKPAASSKELSVSVSKAVKLEGKDLSTAQVMAQFLASARPADYAGLLAYVSSEGEYEEALQGIRASLLGAVGSTQFGYGPRYLHSTGQLHKGGPDNGLFLVLLQEGGPDLPLPGASYGFGPLCAAQALGDFAALEAAGRRAACIRLLGKPQEALRALQRLIDSALATSPRN